MVSNWAVTSSGVSTTKPSLFCLFINGLELVFASARSAYGSQKKAFQDCWIYLSNTHMSHVTCCIDESIVVKSFLDFPKQHQVQPIANWDNRQNQQKLRWSKGHPTNHKKSSCQSIDESTRDRWLSRYHLNTRPESRFHLYKYSRIDMWLFMIRICVFMKLLWHGPHHMDHMIWTACIYLDSFLNPNFPWHQRDNQEYQSGHF